MLALLLVVLVGSVEMMEEVVVVVVVVVADCHRAESRRRYPFLMIFMTNEVMP
jgi:hypothetical protein